MYIITSTTTTTTTTTTAAATTRPSNPKTIPMAMAAPVDRPEGGAEGAEEEEVEGGTGVVAGQVVVSWEGDKSKN